MMKLQKLTSKGMNQLQSDLEELRRTTNPHIDIKRYESKEVNCNGSHIKIDKNKIFENKFAVGKYFLHVFEDIVPDVEIWNWLSILYYKQLLNVHQKIGELQRLFISKSISYYPYTHCLKIPYDICKFYRGKDKLKDVEFLLQSEVNKHKDIYLEIVKRQDMMKNHIFIDVAYQLFYNQETKSFKKSTSDSIRRLIKLWKQYERGFDMYRMPSREVINKLLSKHEEFKLFIK